MMNLSSPQPTEWFTAEFLWRPGPFWEVELPKPIPLRDWPAGTIVRFHGYPTGSCTRGYVWRLTGRKHKMLNMWEGKWPD